MAQFDLQEFEDLYRRYYQHVRAVILRHGFRNQQVDDLIQDTFISAWEKQSGLLKKTAFKAWITTITRNHCLQKVRAQKSEISISPTDEFHDDERSSEELVLEARNPFKTMQLELSVSILAEMVRISSIEPRTSIARMFYLEDKSIKDISRLLDLKNNTVLSHLRRFRKTLSKDFLQRLEQDSPVWCDHEIRAQVG